MAQEIKGQETTVKKLGSVKNGSSGLCLTKMAQGGEGKYTSNVGQ